MAAHRCSSFAQQQLEKHGWKSGQGLGRKESGISEAIKVKIKQDTAGVGHDAGEQFTYHWWDHVFNKAASNIVVETDQDGVKLSRKTTTQGPISNKKQSTDREKKPLLYGNFVKSATLTTEGLQQDDQDVASSSSDEDPDGDSPEATNIDERFFKACGGRTAHKGARHGLTLSGKLKRIQAQEEGHHLPRPPKGNGHVPASSPSHEGAAEGKLKKKRQKKSRKHKSEDDSSGIKTSCTEIVNGDKDRKRQKKCKKMAVQNGQSDPHAYSSDDNLHVEGVENGITNNHEYSSDRSESRERLSQEETETKAVRKKGKKAKRTLEKGDREGGTTICEEFGQLEESHEETETKAARKKAKKAKRTREKREREVGTTICEEVGQLEESGSKEEITNSSDQPLPNMHINGNLFPQDMEYSRKSKKKKSKHKAL